MNQASMVKMVKTRSKILKRAIEVRYEKVINLEKKIHFRLITLAGRMREAFLNT